MALRKEFILPPFGYSIELETQNKELRGKIMDYFWGIDIFVMDPGDETQPLRINNIQSVEPVEKLLNDMKTSRKELKITLKN